VGIVIALVAGYALFALKRSIVEVIAGGAAIGFVLGLVATFAG
jgi:hypothetical protein